MLKMARSNSGLLTMIRASRTEPSPNFTLIAFAPSKLFNT